MNYQVLIVLLFLFTSIPSSMSSQVYVGQKTQHRFAQSYIGLNSQFIPASGKLVWQNQTLAFPQQYIPRLTLGGLHFWGKFDFNINFPLVRFGDRNLLGGGELNFNTGADLSVRYYPWQLIDGKLRPLLGLSFNTMSLSLKNEIQGERVEGFITSSLLVGLSFSNKGWQVNAELMFLPKNKKDFYSNTQQKNRFELPHYYFSLGLVKYFDLTLMDEKPKLSGETKALEQKLLSEGKLNSFSLGIAANSSYFLQAPTFVDDLKSLPRHKGSFNLEYSLGYFFHQTKFHLGLTYRNYSSNSLSYNLEHIIRREALSFEAIKFFWNYNGFVPFVGVSLSAERWATGLFIDDIQQGGTIRSRRFSPGIICGWDIMGSPINTWVLRTNLRYYPYQKINDSNQKKSRVDQFEFNFIQFVIYPNRLVNISRARKKNN